MQLTTSELAQLERCESVIQSGLQTFIEVGNALMEIKDSRLYSPKYDTFEKYCMARWGFALNYANKLIAAASVVDAIGTTVPVPPTAERQVRPLTKLDTPEQRREAWQEAVEISGGKPTAKHVEAAVEKVQPQLSLLGPELHCGQEVCAACAWAALSGHG